MLCCITGLVFSSVALPPLFLFGVDGASRGDARPAASPGVEANVGEFKGREEEEGGPVYDDMDEDNDGPWRCVVDPPEAGASAEPVLDGCDDARLLGCACA